MVLFLQVMVRSLLRVRGAAKVNTQEMRLVLKRAAVKILVSSLLSQFKKSGRESIVELVERHLFTCVHGIPLLNSAHLVAEVTDFVANAEQLLKEIAIMTNTLGSMRPLLESAEITQLLVVLRGLPEAQLMSTPMKLLKHIEKDIADVWNDKNTDKEAVLRLANKSLGEFALPADCHVGVPLFVTCFGPSVFKCMCGKEFGDVNTIDLDDAKAVEELKRNRNMHFVDVFGSDQNGYPTTTSAHCRFVFFFCCVVFCCFDYVLF
jgi:hypothetical protein